MRQMKHWQDYGNVLLGVWLLLSPMVLGFPTRVAAAGNSMAVGVLLLGAALGAPWIRIVWQLWSKAILASWLIVSPAFLHFGTQAGAANAVFTGLLALTLALWAIQDHELAKGTRLPPL